MENNYMTETEALAQYEPMVHYLVKKCNCGTNAIVAHDDLVQEGRIAILIALKNYDDSKGTSLTTWIYNNIQYAIYSYQKKNASAFTGGNYLYDAMNKAGDDIDGLIDFGISKKTALSALYLKNQCAELQSCVAEDEDAVEDFKSVDTFPWRKFLTNDEVSVVSSYFGFDNQDRMTFDEIGRVMGKSRKVISHMLNMALVKLRHIPGVETYYFA